MGGDLSRVKAESELEKYIRTDDDEALPGQIAKRVFKPGSRANNQTTTQLIDRADSYQIEFEYSDSDEDYTVGSEDISDSSSQDGPKRTKKLRTKKCKKGGKLKAGQRYENKSKKLLLKKPSSSKSSRNSANQLQLNQEGAEYPLKRPRGRPRLNEQVHQRNSALKIETSSDSCFSEKLSTKTKDLKLKNGRPSKVPSFLDEEMETSDSSNPVVLRRLTSFSPAYHGSVNRKKPKRESSSKIYALTNSRVAASPNRVKIEPAQDSTYESKDTAGLLKPLRYKTELQKIIESQNPSQFITFETTDLIKRITRTSQPKQKTTLSAQISNDSARTARNI